jgi:hypothetical protein
MGRIKTKIKWQKSSRNEVFKIIRFRTLNHYPSNFVNVGERTNVTGSRKFCVLLKKKKYEALAVEIRCPNHRYYMDEGLLMVFMPCHDYF